MSRGGARPRSGPPKGTKYRPRVPKPEGAIPKPRKLRVPVKVKIVATETAEAPHLVKTEGKLPAAVVAEADNAKMTPLEYVLAAMRDPKVSVERRDRMAALALPFTQARPDGRGKKNERDEKAKAASTGKFAPSAPPTLKAVR